MRTMVVESTGREVLWTIIEGLIKDGEPCGQKVMRTKLYLATSLISLVENKAKRARAGARKSVRSLLH